MKFWDLEGNEFTLAGSRAPDILILNGDTGDKEISVHDLKDKYRGCPPDVWEATQGLLRMLKSGELTQQELRGMGKKVK